MRATTSLTPTPYGSLLQTVSQISFQKLLINRLHEFPHLKTETSSMSNDCCIKDLRDEQHSEEMFHIANCTQVLATMIIFAKHCSKCFACIACACTTPQSTPTNTTRVHFNYYLTILSFHVNLNISYSFLKGYEVPH